MTIRAFFLGLLILPVAIPGAASTPKLGPAGAFNCDPGEVYVGQEFAFETEVSFTVPLGPGRGLVINTFTGTFALFDFRRIDAEGRYVYAVFGRLGDLCPIPG